LNENVSTKYSVLSLTVLHHQNKKKYIKPNNRTMVDWEKFAIQLKHYCQVESCLGNSNFLIRDQLQFKENEDEDKRKKQKV